jgi:hypothetical protein
MAQMAPATAGAMAAWLEQLCAESKREEAKRLKRVTKAQLSGPKPPPSTAHEWITCRLSSVLSGRRVRAPGRWKWGARIALLAGTALLLMGSIGTWYLRGRSASDARVRSGAHSSAPEAPLLNSVASAASSFPQRTESNSPRPELSPPPATDLASTLEPAHRSPSRMMATPESRPVAPHKSAGKSAAPPRPQRSVAAPISTEVGTGSASTGTLTLATVPWTHIYWGDKSLGTTPLVEVALPVGTHRLHSVNAESKIDESIEVIIKPSHNTVQKVVW